MQGALGALGTGLGILILIGLLVGIFFFAAAIGMAICAGLLLWALGAAVVLEWKDWRSGSRKPVKPP